MGIRSEALKKFIYAVPGVVKQDRVLAIMTKVEKSCTVIDERVPLNPEFTNSKVSCPIELSLPPGVMLVAGKDDMVVDYNPGIWPNPPAAALMEMSHFGLISIVVELKKFKHSYRIKIEAEKGAGRVLVELTGVAEVEKGERIALLQKISEALELPLEFSGSNSLPTGRGKTQVAVSYLEPPNSSTELQCNLSHDAYSSLLPRVMAEAKGKMDSWRVVNSGSRSFSELISGINRLGFPCRKTEITYTWRLRSHRDFAAMTAMAVRNEYGEVAQSMFEFEFGGDKRGQFDMAANKKGGFKLWFSFDLKADQSEFTRVTGIKLKEDH